MYHKSWLDFCNEQGINPHDELEQHMPQPGDIIRLEYDGKIRLEYNIRSLKGLKITIT